jgi:hypothetical protein
MGGRRSRALLLILALSLPWCLKAQQGATFAYTGDDLLRSKANVHYLNYGGFANNLVLDEQDVLLPYLPSFLYEAGYLVTPANGHAALCISAMPEVFLYPWLMGRVTGILDANFLNEAATHEKRGLGFRIGIGYSALGSTFDFAESTPVLRAAILIGNIRTSYTYSWGRRTVVDHQLAIAIKFDW